MKFLDFLQFCHDSAISFSLEDSQLKVNAPPNTLTADVVARLRHFKPELLALLEQNAATGGASAAQPRPIVPQLRAEESPVSFGQEQLWLAQKVDDVGDGYHFVRSLDLKGRLDTHALERCFAEIFLRHESLRTVFVERDGALRQHVLAAPEVAIPLADLSALAPAQKRQSVLALCHQLAGVPFDLARDLMLRLQLIRLEADHHQLVVVLHHVASDGWSLGVLVNEFQVLYSDVANGLPPSLPPLPVQYADYAIWQRAPQQAGAIAASLDYWKARLAGAPDVHNLPTDRPRPLQQSFKGNRIHKHLDRASLDALKALAQRSGTTLFMVVETLFAAFLARYSRSDDVVIGTPVANRPHGDVEGLIGYFVNMLPLRHQVDANASLLALLEQARTDIVAAFSHQQAPFDKVVQAAVKNRSASFSPLVQIAFVLQNNEIPSLALPGLQCTVLQPALASSVFELQLEASEMDGGLRLSWEYATDLFDEATVARMATHFELMTQSALRAPDAPLAGLDILSPQERRQALLEWNDTATAFPDEIRIHELFERRAKADPDAVAVVFEDTRLSYAELDARANQLAHFLVESRKVGPDSLVGICIERSLEMVVGIVAILKAGGAYVPLDPEYPEARLAYMLEDARLDTVLTQSHLLAKTPVSAAQALCLDDAAVQAQLAALPASSVGAQARGITSRSLAYVIYTSGSTGNPKGVMVEHRALVNRIDWMDRQYGSTPADRILQKTPFSFDVSVWEFVWPLSVGARIVLAKPEGHKDPVYLSTLIREQQISKLHFVPSMLSSMLSLGDLSQCASLRQVFCSGEALALHHVAEFQARCPGAELHNLYGPTEAAIDVSYWDCSAIDASLGSVPIGRPIHNIQLYVMDQQPAPQGVAGELHIGGVGLARGYLNRPELTAEKFIANPFHDPSNPASSERLYRTGDLVRQMADGNLEYLGRIDHQVKIRGFRIELGEIENALSAHPMIKDAVVLAKETAGGDKRLVAYVVAGEEMASDVLADALRQHLGQSLPDYMVPAAFVVLDQLPVTPNGKADRKALPEPDLAQVQAAYVAPATPTETLLCQVWQQVLGLERVGTTDNFFQLGGHSLLVMQVIARLQEHGMSMPVRQLFTTPTLAELASVLDGAGAARPVFKAPPNLIARDCRHITPDMLPLVSLGAADIARVVDSAPGGVANVQDIYALAPLQEGILFHHMMTREGDPYVSPMLFSIKGRKAVDDFVEAWQFVVRRHDVLRTAVLWKDMPVPVQVVVREAAMPVTWIELATGQDARSHMEALCASDKKWMDLQQAPLANLQIAAESGSDRFFVLLQSHHIIVDHVSLEIIQRELEAYRAGRADSLPPSLPYRELVAHGLHHAGQGDAEAYFRQLLGDVDEPTAPFNLLDVQGDGSRIADTRVAVAAGVSATLRALAKEMMISPAAVFHAAWAMVVSACSGRDDIVFGTVMSGRLQGLAGAENMLGMFINTLPLRVKLDGSADSLVRQVHSSMLDLLPYEQVSLAMAQRCSGLAGGTPLFTAMLNYRHTAPGAAGIGDDSWFQYIGGQERTNYPFNLAVDDLGDGFELDVQVDVSVDPARIAAYVQQALAALVAALATAPATPVHALSVLPSSERRSLLVERNATATAFPADLCLHELFEAQAARTPDAVAALHGDERLSYAQLNERANRLAHYLVEQRAVGTGTLVGICVVRSLDMLVGILAILKAGGAYVPMDPEYPAARLSHFMEDAQVATVLTHTGLRGSIPVTDAQAVCLDDAAMLARFAAQPAGNMRAAGRGLTPGELCYVIYTSGSTGKPKGVMLEHRNVVAFLSWAGATFSAAQLRCVLAATSVCFDLSVFEMFAPLTVGGATLILGNILDLHRGPYPIDISLINVVPSAAEALLAGNCIPASVRTVNTAGEALKQSIVDALYRYGIDEVNDLYGPTEDTVYSCHAPRAANAQPHIGTPIHNSQAFVLGHSLQPVPDGVAGELCLGGAGLARGYLNRPELTAEKFVANPFHDAGNPASSALLYRTGDLVRWRVDGKLEYLGRMDHQVKIRGYRIELGEIESTLVSHPGVKTAVVVARESAAGDKQLAAYVVMDDAALAGAESGGPESGRHAIVAALRAHLAQGMPDYMVPAAFVLLDGMPLTPNGKVDRKALPEPDGLQAQGAYTAPRTDTETRLCRIWQDVLGLAQVGVTDNFFQLGGHSLSATRLVTRINQEFGIALPLNELFNMQTVELLADAVGAQQLVSGLRLDENETLLSNELELTL